MEQTLYISPKGSDRADGLSPVTASGSGPMKTLEGVRKRVRSMRAQGQFQGVVKISVQEGDYPLHKPVCFSHADSNLIIEGVGSDKAVFDGSLQVTGWVEQGNRWVADLRTVLLPGEPIRSLFSAGERMPRSRYPKEGWLYVEDQLDIGDSFGIFEGSNRFICEKGDFDPSWRNQNDIDVVLNHLWVEERMPVEAFDPKTQELTSSHRSIFALKNKGWNGPKHARYFLENVFEVLSEPGEWYYDRHECMLHYIPRAGERIDTANIRLALAKQMIRLHGTPESPVSNVTFKDVGLSCTDWLPSEGWGKWWDPMIPEEQWKPRDAYRHFVEDDFQDILLPEGVRFGSTPQACFELPGVISMEYARNCVVESCSLKHLGWAGIDLRSGCSHNRITRNTFEDIGGGGIKLDGGSKASPVVEHTFENVISDNHLHALGRVFANGIGILIQFSAHNMVEHNEVHDLFYTAISVGWEWGYERNNSEGNQILYNKLYDLGKGRLNDMGGIYMLGAQAGALVKGNMIYDIERDKYGGWGIYLDQGGSQVRVEDNLVYNVASQGLYEHWGRGNQYINNVFAFCDEGAITLCRDEANGWVRDPQHSADFFHNIVITDDKPVFKDTQMYLEEEILRSGLNLYWNVGDEDMVAWYYVPWTHFNAEEKSYSLEELKEMNLETHSLIENPSFANAKDGDYSLQEDSPAFKLGIRPHTFAKAGVRSKDSNRIVTRGTEVVSEADYFGD